MAPWRASITARASPEGERVSRTLARTACFPLTWLRNMEAAKGFSKRARVEPARMSEHGQTPDKLKVNMHHN